MNRNRVIVSLTSIALYLVLALGLQSGSVESAMAQTPPPPPDPGDAGSFQPLMQRDYDFGDAYYNSPDFNGPVEFRARVWYPANLQTGGPFPLIILLHGRHATCIINGQPDIRYWPCPANTASTNSQRIDSYIGYDYLASNLATHGYIVVSISANGINATDQNLPDGGATSRAKLIQLHLDYWSRCNAGPCEQLGSDFVGKVNLQNVGTMGHSRGGEGVIRQLSYNVDEGSPYTIRAVVPLAPTNLGRLYVDGAPFGVILPYCDGDVRDLQGVHYFDDARYDYVLNPPAPRQMFVIMGANHNYFNTIWSPSSGIPGGVDDWRSVDPLDTDPYCKAGSGQRLSEAQQRSAGLAYMNALFLTYVSRSDEPSPYRFYPYLTGDAPSPPSAANVSVHVSYQAQAGADWRKDLNKLLTYPTNLWVNSLGGAVGQSGLAPYSMCGGNTGAPEYFCIPLTVASNVAQQPHTTDDARGQYGLSQLKFGWNNTSAMYQNVLPVGQRDVSRFETIQFRAGVNFADTRNPVGVDQNFSVKLTDGGNHSASVFVASVYQYPRPQPLYFPPGTTNLTSGLPVPHLLLNTVRMPLTRFTSNNPSLDLTNIQNVEFDFNSYRNTGALLVSDIGFDNSLCAVPPPPSLCAIQFQDVQSANTFYPYVNCLVCRDILGGYPCGASGEPCVCPSQSPYFRPYVNITRGATAKIVSNSAGFSEGHTDQIFEDVPPGNTFYIWVERLASRGFISGYACGGTGEPCVAPNNRPYFRPGDYVKRGQIAKIVSNAAGFVEDPGSQVFEDVAPGSTFYDYINRLTNRGIMGGYICGGDGEPCVPPGNRPYFRTYNYSTRGQAAKIDSGAFFPSCSPNGGEPGVPPAVPTQMAPEPVPTQGGGVPAPVPTQ